MKNICKVLGFIRGEGLIPRRSAAILLLNRRRAAKKGIKPETNSSGESTYPAALRRGMLIVFITIIVTPVVAQHHQPGTLSGTYTYRSRNTVYEITFSNGNYTLARNGSETQNGTFRVNRNSVFLGNSRNAYFTIVNAATLRDTDNDLWIKSGKVTISGLQRHNGKYVTGVIILSNDKTLIFSTEPPSESSILGGQISRGSVTLNVYIVDHPRRGILYNTAVPYSGNDTVPAERMSLIVTGTPNYQTSTDDVELENTQAVSFVDGNLEIDFSRGWRDRHSRSHRTEKIIR